MQAQSFSLVQLYATPWTVVCQASLGFFRQSTEVGCYFLLLWLCIILSLKKLPIRKQVKDTKRKKGGNNNNSKKDTKRNFTSEDMPIGN